MDTPITRAEHEEFCRRIDEKNQQQNRQIDLLEKSVEKMSSLVASVERLATNIENMLREQERQGKRLETLEGRDGEHWRKTVGYIATAILGIVIGFVFQQFGM